MTTILSGRLIRGGGGHGRAADRGADRRRRQDDVHEERQRQRRQLHADGCRSSSAPTPTSTPSTSTTACRWRWRSCRQEVRQQGVTVKKKSSALLGVVALYSPKGTYDPLFISNYVTINLLDQIRSTPGVGDATHVRPAGLLHAGLGADRPADRARPDHRRHHRRPSRARTRRRRSGRIGARPISDDQQLQLNIQTKGRLSSPEEFAAASSFAPIPTARCCGSAMSRGWNWAPQNLDRATQLQRQARPR